jgi:hemoglobin-like flavoprotein
MADERTVELYNDSFESCVSSEGFLPRFYELFIGSSPLIREKLKNTDLKKQVRILRKSLYVLTMASLGTDEAEQEIVRLGESHGRHGLNIQPFMYDLWLDCLLQAVSEYHTGWNAEVEQSWRVMFAPHIARLKSYSQEDAVVQ